MNPKALFNITYGMYWLSTRSYGQDNACIINTAVQLTETPMTLSITVNKGNKTHNMIMESGRFNISSLSVDAPFSLFERFGMQSGRDVNKFIGFEDVKRADNGLYVLSRYANSYFTCRLLRTVDLGSHTLFIAALEDAQVIGDRPSCTYSYYHSDIKPKPQPAKKKGWACSVCGHVYEGEQLPEDYICPLCRHGKEAFEPAK